MEIRHMIDGTVYVPKKVWKAAAVVSLEALAVVSVFALLIGYLILT